MKFKVESEIFQKFPGIRIGVIVVLGMDNTRGKRKIAQLLEEEQKKKKKDLTKADLKELPKIAVWRQIYQKFGSKPGEYHSSIEALLKRVIAGNPLPNINPLVDLYNYISLKHLVPVGAEDLDKVKGDIVLDFAKGDEKGCYIGSLDNSSCYPKEVIYKDELGFICRRWNWREAERTKITGESKNAVVVIEANSVVTDRELLLALGEMASLIKEFLKAKVEIKVIDTENIYFDTLFEAGRNLTTQELKGSNGAKNVAKLAEKEIVFKEKLIEKDSLVYQLREAIYQAAIKTVGKRAIKLKQVNLEPPANPEFGDYSTNIAMRFKCSEKFPTPWDLANGLVNNWRSAGLPEFLAKIEVAKPAFINLWLKNEVFLEQLNQVLEKKKNYGQSQVLKGKKILLEHTSPNPQTTIMLGHLRNNFLGMSAANILEFLGAKVTKDCIVNDRGVHICRSLWGYLVFGQKKGVFKKEQLKSFRKISDSKIKKIIANISWRELLTAWLKKKVNWWQPEELGFKPDHANLVWYVLGSRAYNLSKEVHRQVEEILVAWEKEEKNVFQLWRKILGWSDKGYQETYKRVGSLHDWVWWESELYKGGKEIVRVGLKKGIFRKSKGVIVSNLAKYDLPDTVIIKSDRTAVYHTFDLNLTLQKMKKFPADLYIWDIGSEQSLYFKQLFAMCEQLGIGKKDKLFHLAYALINFKGGGKMATRKGDVVMADEILNELHQRALEIIKSSNQKLRGKLTKSQLEDLAEKVAVGSIKYSLLKFSRQTTIYFDPQESLALEGNSGPYLQYTYARTQSIFAKAQNKQSPESKKLFTSVPVNTEELKILRTLYKFPGIIIEAGENYSPNLICNFLFELASAYNLFYNRWPILKAEPTSLRDFRLALTAGVGQIIKNGLTLLGLDTPERM